MNSSTVRQAMTLRTLSYRMIAVFGLFLAISSVRAFAEPRRCDGGEPFDFINHTSPFPFLETWRIDHPNPCQRETVYPGITFRPGDTIAVRAGGCVQTGGHGATWKRYVDPSGPSSDFLYHGLIRLPGIGGLPRIQDFFSDTGGTWGVPYDFGGDLSLALGYEDDDYGDNGYWGHDDGTGGQCRVESDGGPAWIEFTVLHPF